MRPGTGHVPNTAAEYRRLAERPLAGHPQLAGVSVAPSGDRGHAYPEVWNQGASEACVWHAVGQAFMLRASVEVAMGIRDVMPARPSVMQPWILAQWWMQAEQGIPSAKRVATNTGSSVHTGLRALRIHGLVSEARWPLDPIFLTDQNIPSDLAFDMPLDVDLSAADALVVGDYGATGEDFPLVARRALAAGHFPVQSFSIDDSFYELEGQDVEYPGRVVGPPVGRHMMVAVGWRPGWLRFRNSWGPDWGDGGHVWVSDMLTSSRDARDGAVITATPALR